MRGLKDDVIVWALWESDFEMECAGSVLGSDSCRRKRKEAGQQREKIRCNVVSIEASAVQEQRWELSKSCPDGCGVLNATQSLILARGSRTKLADHVQPIPQH